MKQMKVLVGVGAFTELWMFYIAAALTGLGSCISSILVTYVIGGAFQQRRGVALGIALASSGVTGALCNPINGWMVEHMGWRITARVLGFAICLLTILPSIFLIRLPEDDAAEPTSPKGESVSSGSDRRIFYGILIIALVTSSCTAMANQLPLVSVSYGYSTMIGATLTSIAMVSNVGGKILMGVAMDHLGIHRTGKIFVTLVGAGFLLQCMGNQGIAFLYAGTLLYGLIYASATVLFSQLCMAGFGEKQFTGPMSRISAIAQIVTAAISPVIAASYDLFGNFIPVMIMFALGCLACAMILQALQNNKRSVGEVCVNEN